jgi:TetR/AcrR family acrAB operon transcriptional repressor
LTPVDDPASALSKTAQKILAAASKLLEERGFPALTLENVAAEAGVNKASVRYHFGNKAGLLAAVVDEIVDGEMLQLTAKLRDVTDEDRLHAAMVGIQGMITATDCFKGFFDILPHAFRDDEFRTRLVALYPWWYRQNLEWLGLAAESAEGPQGEILQGIAELVAAIVDGLSIQAGLDPERFDLRRPLAALELLLRNSMEQLDQLAGQQPGSSSG